VLLSGDIADHADGAEYERAKALVEPLGAPVYAVAGNHDRRAVMREHFELPGTGGEPVQYAVDLGPLRMVVLDSTRPGSDDGELDGERLEWLAVELARATQTPALVVLHHPPLRAGVPVLDSLCLPTGTAEELTRAVAGHDQVLGLATGHLHRAIAGEIAGRPVLSAPSTHVQARLDVDAVALAFADEPPGFVVHIVADGRLASHVHSVR
jgi:3',5'-cyclic AMP phosphodiesterase CpdA